MSIVLRPGTAADAAACGAVCYEAFKAIATVHNFPPDFPSPQMAGERLFGPLVHPGFYAVVAEDEGKIVGSRKPGPPNSGAAAISAIRSRLVSATLWPKKAIAVV